MAYNCNYLLFFIWLLTMKTDKHLLRLIVVVQSLSCVLLFATSWTAARQSSLSFSVSLSLLNFTSIESVMVSNCLILWCPLLLLPSVFPSIRVFSSELSLCIRRPKYWSFSFSPSDEYSGFSSMFVTLHLRKGDHRALTYLLSWSWEQAEVLPSLAYSWSG